MKIYFAARLTGASNEDTARYAWLMKLLEKYGEVLSKMFGLKIEERKDDRRTPKEIHDRDIDWVTEADVVVAEVTDPSLGVGYEIGRAREMGKGKRVLCIFRVQPETKPGNKKSLTRMIVGADNGTSFIVRNYTDENVDDIFKEFFAAYRAAKSKL